MPSSSQCRPPIGSFAESSDGNVFFARGDQNLKRWDGLLEDYVDAGVPSPTEAMTLSSVAGTANLAGTYFGYVRWLDSRGLVSNVSPLAGPLVLTGPQSGVIEDIFFNDRSVPLRILSYSHGLTTGDKIRVSGVNRFNGEYRIEVYDLDNFYLYYRLKPYDSTTQWVVRFYGYYGGATWTKIGNGIKYTNVEVPTDSRVVKRQILRNKDGNVNTFYIDIEDTDLTETEFTSDKPDASLGEEVPLRATDGTDLNVSRHNEPPDFKRVIIHHFSRLFAGVNLVYRTGSASVTKDSADVTGNATCWTNAMVGRQFFAVDSTSQESYTISSVDVTNQSMVLATNYGGDTNTTVKYAISPSDAEKITIHFSEPALPESWDRDKVVSLTDDPLSGDMTGLLPLGPRLHILFEHRIFSLNYTSDPSVDGRVSFTSARGCVNQRCWIRDGSIAYMMDQRGVVAFNGSEAGDISAPIQSIFSGEADLSIDWSVQEKFHASHDPLENTARWFVSLGGNTVRHALAFNYLTQRWWIEEYPEPMSASAIGDLNHRLTPIWCGSSARVFAPSTAPLDGMANSQAGLRGSVSFATAVMLTDSSQLFSNGSIGAPIHIAEGKGAGQTRMIVAVYGNTVELDRSFSILPDATSVYQVGGFRWKYNTPMLTLKSPPGSKAHRSVETRFSPTKAQSTLTVRKHSDFSEIPDNMEYTRTFEEGAGASTTESSPDIQIDMTHQTGSVQQAFDGTAVPRYVGSRAIRIRLEGVPNGEIQKIYSINIEGVSEQ